MKNFLSRLFPKEYRSVLFLFLSTRLMLFLIMVYSNYLAGNFNSGLNIQQIFEVFVKWDGGWYLNIMNNGYIAEPLADPRVAGQANYAFFPLYPLIVRFIGNIFSREYIIVGVILSNIFAFIGIIYFYKLSKHVFSKLNFNSKKLALNSTLILISFPTAFLFSALLSESLFFMLLVMTLYYSTKHKLFLTIFFGFLTAATRSVGLFVLLPVLYEFWFKDGFHTNFKTFVRNFEYKTLFLFIIPFGMVTFGYYIFTLTGDSMAILEIQEAWGRYLINPLEIMTHHLLHESFDVKFAVVFTIGIFAMLVSGFRKIRIDYWIFSILLFFAPLLNSPLPYHMNSMPRYTLVIIPLYWIFAIYLRKYKDLRLSFIICSALLQGFLASLWTLGSSMVI